MVSRRDSQVVHIHGNINRKQLALYSFRQIGRYLSSSVIVLEAELKVRRYEGHYHVKYRATTGKKSSAK